MTLTDSNTHDGTAENGQVPGDKPAAIIDHTANVKAALSSKYEIVENLGKGEMCTVYRAVDLAQNKEVALEILPPHLDENPEYVDRFHSEAWAAADLSHPNISRIFDIGFEEGINYVAVEYLEGTDLHTLILWKGRLETEEAVKIIAPVTAALAYAHDKGVIHRDIRSSNIIVTDAGRPVLTDFWIDHAFRGTRVTKAERVIGTLEYLSPEQAEGKELDRSSNIYCLGIVLYEALTGRVPFSGGNPFTTVSKIINSPPIPPRQITSSIPEWMEEIVLKCLQKDPKDRFSTAGELTDALFRIRRRKTAVGPWSHSRGRSISSHPHLTHKRVQEPSLKKSYVSESHPEAPTKRRKEAKVPPPEKQIEKLDKVRSIRLHKHIPTKTILKTAAPFLIIAAAIFIVINYSGTWLGGIKTEHASSGTTQSTEIGQAHASSSLPPQDHRYDGTTSKEIESGSRKAETRQEPPPSIIVNPSNKSAEVVTNTPKTIATENVEPSIRPSTPDRVDRERQVVHIPWILVDGGAFQMGSNNYSYTKPMHAVNLHNFYMSATEITFDEYDKFCEATHAKKPSDNGWGRGKMPVINVSWNDAVAFCRWLSDQMGKTVRLPTEAEYEYAARGGSKSRGFQYSGTNDIDLVAWYSGNSGGKPHEVGTLGPNEIGLYDMSGNVWEWCEDWYHQSYDKAPANGGAWAIQDRYNPYRVLRGGSANGANYCSQVSFRFYLFPYSKDNTIGFRCVQEAK
ncbi:MAG TPA: bifunctional serine/threonine-protein kinase/formylglycine-generating enzyme family protein [Candidatus Acidoferrales bacterium]|nr:bifunctional serine/threonine-protein kinase/formylglycine-generating enzyme family protein [Candidatus Acidoferrales bacterium]